MESKWRLPKPPPLSAARSLPYRIVAGTTLLALLAGCASAPRQTAASKEAADIYVLPCKSRQIEFAIPSRWHPEPQQHLDAVQFAYGPVNQAGVPLGMPMLVVDVQPRPAPAPIGNNDPQDADLLEQEKIAQDALQQIRKEGFAQAGIVKNGRITRPDGRVIQRWLEVSNVKHIVSFIPDGECTVEVNMWAAAADEPESLADFEAVVGSVKTTDTPNPAARVILNHARLLLPQPAFELIAPAPHNGIPDVYDYGAPDLSVYAAESIRRDKAGNVFVKLFPEDAKKLSALTHAKVGKLFQLRAADSEIMAWRAEKPIDDGIIEFVKGPATRRLAETLPGLLHLKLESGE